MITDFVKTLSATPPPGTKKFQSGRHAYARIIQLETQLGLEPSSPIFNTIKATARIAELESMLAKKNTPLPVPSMAATPAASVTLSAPVADTLPLADYLRLSSVDRWQYSQDGGKLALASYNALSPAAKLSFIKDGGRVQEDRQAKRNSLYAGGQY
jgi:hypothetical protein